MADERNVVSVLGIELGTFDGWDQVDDQVICLYDFEPVDGLYDFLEVDPKYRNEEASINLDAQNKISICFSHKELEGDYNTWTELATYSFSLKGLSFETFVRHPVEIPKPEELVSEG